MTPEATGGTISGALAAAKRRLADLPSAALDCQLLLAHALGVDRSWLYAHGDDALCPGSQAAFEALLARRYKGEPVAYLIGEKSFWTMTLAVDQSTLMPRPETECLVEAVLDRRSEDARLRIADLGTGSGAIAIALALERPDWQISRN
ncbi:MAG: HemK/PrmC family methyltransferase [Gammaproteobacteria bacterium]|nr:HemK/PrmC family methyltransferase [Gammaproteobacteria bacterium]